MEEATWQGMWVNPRSWVHPLVDSQQGNRDFSLTTARKCLLLMTSEFAKGPYIQMRTTAPANTFISVH